ncbi:MAG: glutamine--fructose-6-phosphate transaminase (isomerizing) [Bacilli bacterium]|nr:glutamine--fructose-6-phosphate transaminase (isomerizing) [Bacilli bacterium]
MCGIVGGVGKLNLREYLISGLKKLEYRGYDSAGIAYAEAGEVIVRKVAGRVVSLDAVVPNNIHPSVGIAHTRWATHGQPNSSNAHPHQSNNGLFTIVHNGVIENFRPLTHQLAVRGFHFASETDTEVIANLLERFYTRSGSVLEAIAQTCEAIEGSFACAIIFKDEPNRLYFMKKASPLLIGVCDDASLLASDPAPMVELTDRFIDLDDGDYGFLEVGKVQIFRNGRRIKPRFVARNVDLYKSDLGEYPHYMLKEIEEIPSVIKRLCENYFDEDHFLFNESMLECLRKAKQIHFLACGTSYYASKIGAKYLRPLGKDVLVSIASEWAYDPYDITEEPVFVLLSQSGETADLIRCQKIINDRGGISIAVTNTKGSTIERKATYSCLLYAGLEVAVASTKSYLAQVCFLLMLTGALRGDMMVMADIDRLCESLKDIIARKEEIHSLARHAHKVTDAFFVGRGLDYLASMEGALKLKEVAYVHAESYPGGELKHGPIALITQGTLVVGFVSDPEVASSIRNNFEELSSRGARMVVLSTASLQMPGDSFVTKDVKPYLASSALVMVSQYFAYYMALEKGLPIDKPRNLAKSVTVE